MWALVSSRGSHYRGYIYEPTSATTYRVLTPGRVELGSITKVHPERDGRTLTTRQWLAYPLGCSEPLRHETGDPIGWPSRYDAALGLLQSLEEKEISSPGA